MAKPTVAIVGRPNVGKSTIFNRLVGERISIVEDTPGVTRDRIYSTAEWLNDSFHVIDTGGIEIEDQDEILHLVREQADLAIHEADVIIFIVDGQTGITTADEEISRILFRSKKPIVLAVNKIDHPKQVNHIYDFYTLGVGDPFPISGAHGTGLGDMLDEVARYFPDNEGLPHAEDVIRVSVIGRPNVGKSSLINALLGEERVIVSSMAGTTRDAIDTPVEYEDQSYVLVDTAGMRKRGKVYEKTEKYSVLRALKAIERSDVVLVVINADEGIIEQDKKIAGYAHDAGRSIIIVVNKWDAVPKEDQTMSVFTKEVRRQFQFLDYAPILFVSAKTKRNIHSLLPKVRELAEYQVFRIQTPIFNDMLVDAITMRPPPAHKGRRLKINYGTQVAVKPPTFVIFVNDPKLMHFSYVRYIENKIRESFPFEGTPIRIFIREKSDRNR